MKIRNVADVAALIRDRRIQLGWTQQDLADKTGTSRKWVSDIESAKGSVNLSLVLRCLNALDVPIRADKPTAVGGADYVDLNGIIESTLDRD